MALGDLFDKKKREEKALKKERKKKNKIWQQKLVRELSYADCAAALEQCKRELDAVIRLERMRYKERLDKGMEPQRQRERIANAAKGRRVVDQAMAELEDNRYTEDLNSSINLVCLAVRQLERVSDSTPSVNKRFYSRAKDLFHSEKDYEEELNSLELPPEVDKMVDRSFVDNLIAGDSYDTCLRKYIYGDKNAKSQTADQLGRMLDETADSGEGQGKITLEDEKAVKEMMK